MQDKVGEVFAGTVAGVTSFGLFVALDEVYVEGLLHVTDLGNDYFIHDKARHEMVGERTGVRYRLGDRLTVKVVRVDLETARIDFTLAGKGDASDEGAETETVSEAGTSSPRRSQVTEARTRPASPYNAGKTGKATGNKASSKARTATTSASSGKEGAGKPRTAKEKNRRSVQKNKGKPKAKAR
jgi:ribonuclease R